MKDKPTFDWSVLLPIHVLFVCPVLPAPQRTLTWMTSVSCCGVLATPANQGPSGQLTTPRATSREYLSVLPSSAW